MDAMHEWRAAGNGASCMLTTTFVREENSFVKGRIENVFPCASSPSLAPTLFNYCKTRHTNNVTPDVRCEQDRDLHNQTRCRESFHKGSLECRKFALRPSHASERRLRRQPFSVSMRTRKHWLQAPALQQPVTATGWLARTGTLQNTATKQHHTEGAKQSRHPGLPVVRTQACVGLIIWTKIGIKGLNRRRGGGCGRQPAAHKEHTDPPRCPSP